MKRQGRMWRVGARAPVWMVLGACSDDGTRASDTAGATTTVGASTSSTGEGSSGVTPTGSTPTTSAGSSSTDSQGETQATTVGVTTELTSTSTTGTTEAATTGRTPDMGPACIDTCVDGTCIGELCCPINQACTDTCCAQGEVCSFQQCVVPGDDCIDATDCPPDAYCEYTLGEMEKPPMCMGGVSLTPGKCLPTPPECPDGVEPVEGEPITCLPSCEIKPPVDDFGIVLKAAWGGQVVPPYGTDVMMSPIVAQLDDDNCDGKVNEKDIPEIIFSTFTGGGYYKQGTLHAISLVDGKFVDKINVPNVTQPGAGLAAADLDADGIPEIVGCMNPGPAGVSCCDAVAQNTGVVAFKADGTTLWTQPNNTKVYCGYEAPVVGENGPGPSKMAQTLRIRGLSPADRKIDPKTTQLRPNGGDRVLAQAA